MSNYNEVCPVVGVFNIIYTRARNNAQLTTYCVHKNFLLLLKFQ